jgi:hypothetical protein
MTPEKKEKLRELYRKNFLALILLPPEVVADEFPDLPLEAERGTKQGGNNNVHRTDVD